MKKPKNVIPMGHKVTEGPFGPIVVKEKCPECKKELTKNGYCRSCKIYCFTSYEWGQ